VVNISSQGESLITANDASSQRNVMGLGSAATKDVGTSAGNVMEVASSGIQVTDFNNMPTTFSSAWAQAGVTNPPVTGSLNWTALRIAGSNLNNGMEIFSANGANRYFMRTESGNTYTPFSELYHSGNSVNPLDYGLGVSQTDLAPNISNYDTNKASGLYRSNGGESGQPFNSSIGSIINLKRGSTNSVNQIYVRGNENGTDGQMYFRGGVGSTFSDWFEVYHSGNTNFNEFGGTNAGDVIATGFCVSGSVARFFLPINSITVATGVTVSGAFDVRAANGGYLATGVVPSAVGIHSNRLAAVQVDSLSVSAGDSVWLSAVDSTSKIKANF